MLALLSFCIVWRQPLRCFGHHFLRRLSRLHRPAALALLEAGAVLGLLPLPPPVPLTPGGNRHF